MVKTKLIEQIGQGFEPLPQGRKKNKAVCDKSIRDGKAQKTNGAYQNHCGAEETCFLCFTPLNNKNGTF
jgi:hypothetical protein